MPPAEVFGWLREHVQPFEAIDAGHGVADLASFRSLVGDARVVALGESTHSTSEFFRLKHRLLEHLVSELGFTAIAVEANFPEALDIDRYVLTGEGDPAKALTAMYFWAFNTEEILGMIRWIRSYNAAPEHRRKVHVYGLDLQYSAHAIRQVATYLARIDPPEAERFRRELAFLANPYTEPNFERLPQPLRQDTAALADRWLQAFDQRRDGYVRKSGATAFTWARQLVRVIQQNLAFRMETGVNSQNLRDRAMAENAIWLLDQEGPSGKVVVWAHNLHVATDSPPPPRNYQRMGWHLRQRMGRALRIVGLTTDRGTIKAWRVPMSQGAGVCEFTLPAPLPGSLEHVLTQAGPRRFLLDLRSLPAGGPVQAWFGQPHPTRVIGSGFTDEDPDSWYQVRIIPQLWDAVIFVADTHASRPFYEDLQRFSRVAQPTNLDFEAPSSSPADGAPGWTMTKRLADFDYQVKLTAAYAHSGKQSVLLERTPTRAGPGHYGEMFASIEQHLDATPYRGHTVRVRAWMRIDARDTEDRGYLWLRVAGANYPATGTDTFYDGMVDRPLRAAAGGSGWRQVELTGPVAATAEQIVYGAAFVGEGRAWVDGFDVTVLP